jgi:methylated-DNA-[protein]-cysteine S-methyltransferase
VAITGEGDGMTWKTTFDSPLGEVLVAATEQGVCGVYFVGQKYFPADATTWEDAPGRPMLRQARRELLEYFAGRRKTFGVALDPRGTPFQRRVWQALLAIGYGTTTTYGAIGAGLGDAGAARAVGAAVGRNPISIIVPCHRVVGAGGALTGYAGGIDRKRALLSLEGQG